MSATSCRFKSAQLTDRRVKIMNEVITGMRVIKMYAWEHAFRGVVDRLRRLGLGTLPVCYLKSSCKQERDLYCPASGFN